MADPRVALIVLNYNGRDITLEAVGSLLEMTYPSFDVIHLDNGSGDGSTEAVAAAHSRAINVRTEENLGPAGGLNLGMRKALEGDYDYLVFCNNDIEVDPEMLTHLVRVAELSPDIGCVCPKGYYYWDRERIWSAGGYMGFREAATRERGMGEIDRGQYDRDEEIDYVNGAVMLIRRKALEEVGYWDPAYFLAGEDADLCMRIRRRGYKCFFSHQAVFWHMVSHTSGGYEARRTFYTGRSAAIFTRRYANLWQWLSFVALMGVSFPLAFLRELPKGNQSAVLAKFRGVMEGLRVPLPPPPAVEPELIRTG